MKGMKPEYLEMVAKSTGKLYTPEDMVRLGMAPTPRTAVHTQGTATLFRYSSQDPSASAGIGSKADPVLLVPSLINRPYIMDLLKGHSLIGHLADQGFDLFLLDWGFPDESVGHLGLDHFIGKYIARAVRHVRKITGARKVQLAGQCLGGTMTLAYAAHPELRKDLSSLSLLTAPVNLDDSGLLSDWTSNESFDIFELTRAYDAVVPPEFFHACFPFLDVNKSLGKYKGLLENFELPDFPRIWQSLDYWANDNVPFALTAFRDLIHLIYQKNQIYLGEYEVLGRKVDFRDIDLPMLSVAAEQDHVFTVKAAEVVSETRSASSGRLIFRVMPAGHVTLIAAHPVRAKTFEIFGEFLGGVKI